MFLSGGSATGIAGAVWTNASRTLTGFGGAALSFPAITRTFVAASGTVTLRPVASTATLYTAAGTAGAAGPLNFVLADGTNVQVIVALAASSSGGTSFTVNNSVFAEIINGDAANNAFYIVSGVNFKA